MSIIQSCLHFEAFSVVAAGAGYQINRNGIFPMAEKGLLCPSPLK
jgi:hypothetical protein